MSTYSFHVLYQHSTPHAVTTLVVLLSASVCIFLWFNRKAKQPPAILVADPQVVSESPSINLSKETAPEVEPPRSSSPAPPSSSKKGKPTKGDKKGDKGKKRQGKQDGPPAPKVRTLAHRRPARRLEDSPAAPITEDQQEEQHAPQSFATQPSSSETKPPEDGTSTGSPNSPPRAASPSPSEATTATTAVTIQSSTLILTPPPTVLPGLVALPVEHEKDARAPPSPPPSNDGAALRLNEGGDEEPNPTATDQIEHEGWIRVDNETPTTERREPLSPLLVPPPTIPIDITTPTSLQDDTEPLKASPTASTPNIPPPDDGETVVPSPTPSHQPPAIITPATPDNSEPPALPRPSPSSQPRSLTPSEYPRSPRTRQGSSGGVGLGIPGTTPAAGSQSRVGVSRSSPASSPLRTGHIPLPPRHRRHQPGQPQQVPPPLLQPLPPYGHYGGRPSTPGSGMRSPTSPGVPFVGAPGWIPGPAYSPMAHQQPPPPQAFLRPYPPPGYMHPPGPPGPHGAAVPPPGPMPYLYYPGNMNNSHGRSRSVSDISPYQGGVAGMTSIVPVVPPAASQNRTAGSKSGTHDVKGKTKASGDGGEEAEKEDEDFVVEFPTLNPTPGKPSQSSESENAGEGASNTVSEAQSVEQQQPTGWMSPGFAPYPPEMLGYPHWSPQASAYFQPRPYPHPSQMPGASTPSTSSTSSSPAWTHLGLPPPNAAPVPPPNNTATPAEAGAGGPQEEDLRRQTLVNSIANRPGTSTPSASGSATSSPRIAFNQLQPPGAPPAMPPYAQPHSPLTPTSGPVPLMPNPHLMRQGPPPSPGPMAGSWHGSSGYFMPGPVPPPHPQWIAAQNSPRSGTPSGEPAGAAFLASPRSRSSSPFVGGRATPPVQGMYPGYFSPPPHMNYPYGPVPPPPMQHALMMQGLPPTPSPSYVNGRRSSANSSPLQSRSRKITANELGASAGGVEEGDDSDHDSPVGVLGALDFKDPEGFKGASSSGNNSRGGSRAASETGGGGSEKGSARGSPSIEEEPPQTA